MMLVEDFKDINNSLKEIQENTAKQKSLKRKNKNHLKNYRKTLLNR
jgi:FtsZ-binding cell division protein ZapB